MGRAEIFLSTKNHHNLKKKLLINSFVLHCGKAPLAEIFFPFFYNIKEDTEIIIFQSNVRKIYGDPKTV